MTIILNEGDCVDPNGVIIIDLNECRRTVKSDEQVIYEIGDIGIRPGEVKIIKKSLGLLPDVA